MDFATDAVVKLRQELSWLIDFTAFTTPTSRNRNTKIIKKGGYDLMYTMLAVPESSRWVRMQYYEQRRQEQQDYTAFCCVVVIVGFWNLDSRWKAEEVGADSGERLF